MGLNQFQWKLKLFKLELGQFKWKWKFKLNWWGSEQFWLWTIFNINCFNINLFFQAIHYIYNLSFKSQTILCLFYNYFWNYLTIFRVFYKLVSIFQLFYKLITILQLFCNYLKFLKLFNYFPTILQLLNYFTAILQTNNYFSTTYLFLKFSSYFLNINWSEFKLLLI